MPALNLRCDDWCERRLQSRAGILTEPLMLSRCLLHRTGYDRQAECESQGWKRLRQVEEGKFPQTSTNITTRQDLINHFRLTPREHHLLFWGQPQAQLQALRLHPEERLMRSVLFRCGQQSCSESSSSFSFIQFHLPLLEFKNCCESLCARTLLPLNLV